MKLLIRKLSDISTIDKEKAKEVFSLKHTSDKTISGRALLLELLNDDVDEIIYNENGKPYFKNKKIYFSISHSYEYVACAISDKEIGIDIQKIKDVPKSKLVFNENELELSNIELVKLWTMKESIIKLKGLNMQYMNKVNVNDYNIKTQKIDNDYIISICEIV